MKPLMAFAAIASAATLASGPARADSTPAWDLAHREYWIQDRIERGRKDGSLDPAEARRAAEALRKIQHDESFDAETNNGKLSARDLTSLETRLDDLSDHIHWLKGGEVRRPW